MQKHKLGFGAGVIVEDGGTASYRKPASFSSAFKVRIADVTGFTVGKGDEKLTKKLKLFGHGTELAAVDVPHGVSEKVEAWFRAHPEFGGRATAQEPSAAAAPAPSAVTPSAVSIADELSKLAGLRDQGVLTDDEFAAQKARLLASG